MDQQVLVSNPFETLFHHTNETISTPLTTVIMTCYKYGKEGIEALDSLINQTEKCFKVIIIDDQSPDDSVYLLTSWLEKNAMHDHFAEIKLIRHIENQGLSRARNTAISIVDTKYTFVLDADNQLYPRALQRLREAIENSKLPMAYSLIEVFEGEASIIGNSVWIKEKFAYGNYIDAMAMIETALFHQLDGYRVMPHKFGWEDYDFWCKMLDHGYMGCHVPQILCRYRVHPQSMLRTITNEFVQERRKIVKADFEAHHKMKFAF